MYFVYLLKCADKSIYTGITTDVERRFLEHKAGTASHYTAAHRAVKIVHVERFKDRSSASKREAEIKKWSRERKLALISSSA
jgi:putative endonuclease